MTQPSKVTLCLPVGNKRRLYCPKFISEETNYFFSLVQYLKELFVHRSDISKMLLKGLFSFVHKLQGGTRPISWGKLVL